ncbi:DNA polymerase beta domain-containing protein, partial [Candidatus Magnetobacterium bavaricum]
MNAIEILKNNGELIRDRYGVKRIGIFGSFARGQGNDNSDVDVLVEFREDSENFDNYIEL